MPVPNKRYKNKRDREKALQEKRKEKIARRTLRKEEKASQPLLPGAEDPDLVGITLGPQPPAMEEGPEQS